jgi:hypothetical protein
MLKGIKGKLDTVHGEMDLTSRECESSVIGFLQET